MIKYHIYFVGIVQRCEFRKFVLIVNTLVKNDLINKRKIQVHGFIHYIHIV